MMSSLDSRPFPQGHRPHVRRQHDNSRQARQARGVAKSIHPTRGIRRSGAVTVAPEPEQECSSLAWARVSLTLGDRQARASPGKAVMLHAALNSTQGDGRHHGSWFERSLGMRRLGQTRGHLNLALFTAKATEHTRQGMCDSDGRGPQQL